MATVTDSRLKDPLMPVTRETRHVLLIVCVVAFVVVKGGLLPEEITALGIKFTRANHEVIINVLIAVVAYYTLAFLIYAASDYTIWKVDRARAIREWIARREEQRHERSSMDERLKQLGVDGGSTWYRLTGPVATLRALLDFAFPIAVAMYTIATLFSR